MPNLPQEALLYKSSGKQQTVIRKILRDNGIRVREIRHYAELGENFSALKTAVAIAIIDDADPLAIGFLRACMHAHTYVQRILLTTASVKMDLLYEAINRAHINYIAKLPPDEGEILDILRKATVRFHDLTRPFQRMDALTQFTENLLQDKERYRLEANTDTLTSLLNRRAFNEVFTRFMENMKKHHFHFALAMLDIDHFKKINDTYSHQGGDFVLKELSKILSTNQRIGMDYIFRYGGEEFAILSAAIAQKEMLHYIERLLMLVRSHSFRYEDKYIRVTFSAGIVESSLEDSGEELIKKVDAALYFAKDTGRNQCLVFESSMLK